MSGMWGWVPFVGGIVIVAAIAWAMLRNRRDTDQRDMDRTEAATRELYDQQEREDRDRDEGRHVPGDR